MTTDNAFWLQQIESLRAALAAAERIRQMAEENYRQALEALREVARLLMPDVVEKILEAGREPGPAEIVEAARGRAALLKVYLASSASARILEQGEEIARLRAEVARLQPYEEQARALEAERNALREKLQVAEGTVAAQTETINRLRAQVLELRRQLAEVLAKGPVAPAEQADGRQEEQEEQGEQGGQAIAVASPLDVPLPADSADAVGLASDDPAWAIVRALGETGHCLRATIARAAGLGDPTSGYVREMFGRLKEAGLIEEQRPEVESVGRTPYLVRLTERGRDAYARRYGGQPAESIYDRLMGRHKSVEHAYLNLRAASVLEEHGYTVDMFPRDVRLAGGGTFAPDLIAAKDGRVFYVECERETRKNPEERARKWEIYHGATGGEFYLVVPNKQAQSSILSEIGQWAYSSGNRVRVSVCNLALLQEGSPDVWTLVRDIHPRR